MNTQNAHATINDSILRLHDALKNGRTDTIEKYLAAAAQFYRYSLRNIILIHEQFPEATIVAGFHAWKKHNRWVMKGEAGIAIFAPMVARRGDDKLTEVERKSENDKEGKARTTNFRVTHVFDVSQTDGEPLVAMAPVTGSPGENLDALLDVYRKLKIKVEFTQLPGSVQGYSLCGEVRVQDGLDDSQTFRILVHELAHEMMHKTIPFNDRKRKVVVETEAEAVAFVVSRACGLEHLDRSADYISLYQGASQQLSESLIRIHDTASRIIVMIEHQVADSESNRQHAHAA